VSNVEEAIECAHRSLDLSGAHFRQIEDAGGKTDKGAGQLDSAGGAIKIKNKAKNKAKDKVKQINQSKNKTKKEWKQR
jgi:hypothetical protein